jgi:hypothetical protein
MIFQNPLKFNVNSPNITLYISKNKKIKIKGNREMAHVLDNPNGRRMIRLSIDDIIMVVSMYQQKCNCRDYTYDEIRDCLKDYNIYLPEDMF